MIKDIWKIGDNVYCTLGRYRNLTVTDIKGEKVECKGESYHEDEKYFTNGWHPCEASFMKYELRDTPYTELDNVREESKWEKL